MDHFTALVIDKNEAGQSVAWRELTLDDLMTSEAGRDVDVRISASTLNYKDALAITGKAPVVRRWPMIPGIDFAGSVSRSAHADFKVGDKVLLNGWGVGETHMGGYAQMARVPGDWLIKRPEAFDAHQAMALGTAGYTAMLCVMALERHGLTPDAGKVLVTGAAGGVGSVAVLLLARLGFDVVASTGRLEEADYLKALGAGEVIDRAGLSGKAKPLGRETWAGAIDVAGSNTLANVLSQVRYGGCVAACGLAQGMDLPGSVAPFILRAITLAGVDSVMVAKPKRIEAWQRLARDIDSGKLAELTETHPLSDVVDLAPKILEGKIRGRIVLDVG